ncbi:MAG: ATP-binding protein [Bacteroidia bacterium]
MQGISNDTLAQFYELSLDLFCLAGEDGYFKYINKAWETCLGYDRETLLSRPYLEFVHPDDKQDTRVEQQRLASGALVLDFVNRYRAKDGSWKWLSWKAAPQPSGEIYAVARDITTQKEDERATKLLMRKLELSNQELDRFAYVVSHDLKTPLRGIANLAEWIAEDLGDNLPEHVKEHIDMMQERVELMQQLIDDMLRYARTGRSGHELGPVDVSQIIDEIQGMIDLPEGFELRKQEGLPTIMGVRLEVLQMFQNLIVNAIKYRTSDEGWVSVRAESDGPFWRFIVCDNGIGIDPKFHDRVFEIFQRLGDSADIEGNGIGLAVVKKIVEAIGGNIQVESDGKSGTCFTFTWPKRPAERVGR